MMQTSIALFAALLAVTGCVTKTVCANGTESFRPVLDPVASCKIRIRQVIVGTDVKTPESLSMEKSATNWSYGWINSDFKDGQIVLGHIVLKPESPATEKSQR